MNPRNYTDILAGAAVALFAVTGLVYLIPVGVKSPPNVKVPALAPEFWPTIVLWLMLAFAIIILIQGVIAVMRSRTNEEPEQNALAEEHIVNGPHGDDALLSTRVLRTIVAIGLLFAYQALIEVIGMLAVSILACLAFTILSGERRYKIFLPVAVLLPTILYYFFTKVAGVPLPLGIFEELNL